MLDSLKKIVSKFFGMFTLGFHTPVRIQKLTHILLFLFSLVLSIAFWCFVSYDSEVKAIRTFSVPVRYIGLSSGLDKKVSIDVVRVKVSGKEKSLLVFSADDLRAVVDLKRATVGTHFKDIQVTSASNDVTVSRVYPLHCKVTIYRRMKRILPVNVSFVGKKEDKNITDVIVTPSQIVVSGREESVKSVSELNVLLDTAKLDDKGNITLPVIIKGLAEDLVNDTGLTLSQKNVVAHVVFNDEIISKELPLKFSLVGHPQNNLIITRAVLLPATVKVTAKASFFKTFKNINLGNVDVSNVRGTTSMSIPFVIPNEFGNSQYVTKLDAPDNVRLNLICKEHSVKKNYTNVPIKLIGSNESDWTFSHKGATVTVEVTDSVMNSSNDEHPFEIFVDATNIVKKKITLPISFRSKKSGIKLLGIEPNIVTITRN